MSERFFPSESEIPQSAVSIGEVSYSSRRDLTGELHSAGIYLQGIRNPNVWYIRGAMPDTTFKLRLAGEHINGVTVREHHDGPTSHIQVTDTGIYRDAPCAITVQRNLGVVGLTHGEKNIEPIRIITDADHRYQYHRFGLHTRPEAKLIVFPNGARALQRRGLTAPVEWKAAFIHRSPYAEKENFKVTNALNKIIAQSIDVSVGHQDHFSSEILFECRTVYKNKQPYMIWVVPMAHSHRHGLLYETSDASRLHLSFREKALVKTLESGGSNRFRLVDGSMHNRETVRSGGVVYEYGAMPRFTQSKGGCLYRDQSKSNSGIPVVFQGCVLWAAGERHQAAYIQCEMIMANL